MLDKEINKLEIKSEEGGTKQTIEVEPLEDDFES